MKKPAKQDELISRIADLDEQAALAVVGERLKQGYDPFRLIELCKEGVRQVGERYEAGQYFVAGLIMAGAILRSAFNLIRPELSQTKENIGNGNVLVGTVKDDIHDIGKSLGIVILNCEGFDVVDLGVDVPEQAFVEAIEKHRPRIVGLSCMLTTAFERLKSTIDAIESSGLRKQVAIFIAGSLVDENICQYVQADHWANDAVHVVQWCKRIIAKR